MLAHPLLFLFSLLAVFTLTDGFGLGQARFIQKKTFFSLVPPTMAKADDAYCETSRRSFLDKVSCISCTALIGARVSPGTAVAAVGTLPEFSDSNAILQGISVNVADKGQQDSMISFLESSFDFIVLRKRILGTVEETWMGFGPEQLSIPSDFTLPVSSFSEYGGHASICIRYDSRAMTPFYRTGSDSPPGNNIAYLQVGVPTYRISQMVRNGGNILDAYGIVNVISPCGLPMRGIVGIRPDPIMFVAIRCQDLMKSKAFYEKLGFIEQEYPFARPNKGMGQFEPPQPPKSVYLAPSANCMGILLLPKDRKVKQITQNPVVDALRVVYTPSSTEQSGVSSIRDPSGVPITFQDSGSFEKEEKATR